MIWEEGKIKEDPVMYERRKFPRHSKQLYLKMFVYYDTNEQPTKITSFKVKTLDLSRGGLRIESPQVLAPGSIICFEPDDDIASQGMSGIGEVRWCNPSKKLDYFEFGIALPALAQRKLGGV